MIRPNGQARRLPASQDVWEEAKKRDRIETFEQQEVFHITEKEAKKCRFEVINQTERMYECYIHRDNYSHGVRMFPPIYWNLIDGIVYYRKSKEDTFKRWLPSVKENKERFNDSP